MLPIRYRTIDLITYQYASVLKIRLRELDCDARRAIKNISKKYYKAHKNALAGEASACKLYERMKLKLLSSRNKRPRAKTELTLGFITQKIDRLQLAFGLEMPIGPAVARGLALHECAKAMNGRLIAGMS